MCKALFKSWYPIGYCRNKATGWWYAGLSLIAIAIAACSKPAPSKSDRLFELVSPTQSGIRFANNNKDTDSLSIIDYLYYYNGGGVAVGDINNDGLPDIFFTANAGNNTLYLNKGDFRFEDITLKAGITVEDTWATGVTMADVNNDGYLDIYVSAVANHNPHTDTNNRLYFPGSVNKLFINNRNLTFTEAASQWGLNLRGYNTQAVFFDYDKDGDLDLFQLQHSTHQPDAYGPTSLRERYSDVSGGKLFRNDSSHFTDVTRASGIISSALGYGLGVAVADMNHDGYDDICVGNDFHENDYYYLNQGDGRFKEMHQSAFGHSSTFSMGNDVADINNDGWPDIFSADMLPADEKILKSSLGDGPLDTYLYQRSLGYAYQYSRNCLQLNTAEGTRFSDIGLYSGVAATDWSWSPLLADYDLDGYMDLFVSNGIKKRPNDLDYIKFISALPKNRGADPRAFDRQILAEMPDGAWHNYVFAGTPGLRFKDMSVEWGLEEPGLSQGAMYADLDGDGDLDLVTNNMNAPAGIYRNTTRERQPDHHYFSIRLRGNPPNGFAVGTKVFLFADAKLYYKQLQPVHGFLSSGDLQLNFGLGAAKTVDSLMIIWPDNTLQTIGRQPADLSINITQAATGRKIEPASLIRKILAAHQTAVVKDITAEQGIHFTHTEDSYFDFNDQWFIPHEQSTMGPKLAVGDLNGDGLEDFYVCGAKGQAGQVFLQQKRGGFKPSLDSMAFVAAKSCEDVDAFLFDADNDQDLDLYVVSGGNVYTGSTPLLHDRLYINNGHAVFSLAEGALPAIDENKSVVTGADFDHDGDIDLFVGGQSFSRNYSRQPVSYLLLNDGQAHFSTASPSVIQGLDSIGRVTGAVWVDIEKDGWMDLLITGEWMPPVLYRNHHGTFERSSLTTNDDALKGWWSAVSAADYNGDGHTDILLGNFGENSKLNAAETFPLKMYSVDFYQTGREHQLLAAEKNGNYYPFLNKEDLENQLPYLKNEYLKYGAMAGKTMEEIFGDKLLNARLFTASTLQSICLENDGTGHYTPVPLPGPAQWSPIHAFAVHDFNQDGQPDVMTGGNFYGVRPYEGRYDALSLAVFYGAVNGKTIPVFPLPPALAAIEGEVRDIKAIRLQSHDTAWLVAVNNGPLHLLRITP